MLKNPLVNVLVGVALVVLILLALSYVG